MKINHSLYKWLKMTLISDMKQGDTVKYKNGEAHYKFMGLVSGYHGEDRLVLVKETRPWGRYTLPRYMMNRLEVIPVKGCRLQEFSRENFKE